MTTCVKVHTCIVALRMKFVCISNNSAWLLRKFRVCDCFVSSELICRRLFGLRLIRNVLDVIVIDKSKNLAYSVKFKKSIGFIPTNTIPIDPIIWLPLSNTTLHIIFMKGIKISLKKIFGN